jgi:hypothetical protein
MKSAFEQGMIKEIWKSKIEMEKWFDPAFQEFVDKELIPLSNKQCRSPYVHPSELQNNK